LGDALRAEHKDGRVVVRWEKATDPEGLYGYEVLRGEGDEGLLLHVSTVREKSQRFEDTRVLPGSVVRYAVRPFDLAGNRGPLSATVTVRVPSG
jgi:fibronectin type 3 domain-containing protein